MSKHPLFRAGILGVGVLVVILLTWYGWRRNRDPKLPEDFTFPSPVTKAIAPQKPTLAKPVKGTPSNRPVIKDVILDRHAQKELKKCTGVAETTLESFATKLQTRMPPPTREGILSLNHHFQLENGRTLRIHQNFSRPDLPSMASDGGEGEKISVVLENAEGVAESNSLDPEVEGKSSAEIVAFYKSRGTLVLEQELKFLAYADGTELELHRANSWIESIEWRSGGRMLSCSVLFEPESGTESVACKCIVHQDNDLSDPEN